jgi:hypothetical protein
MMKRSAKLAAFKKQIDEEAKAAPKEPERPKGAKKKDWEAYLKSSQYKELLVKESFDAAQRRKQKAEDDEFNDPTSKRRKAFEEQKRWSEEQDQAKRDKVTERNRKAREDKGKYGDLHRMIAKYYDNRDFAEMTYEEKKKFFRAYKKYQEDEDDDSELPSLPINLQKVATSLRFG